MENTTPVKNQQLQLKSVYTLHLEKNSGIEKDESLAPIYNLAKNGMQSLCPFSNSGTQKDGFAMPCGTFCQHFNLVPQKMKKKEMVKEGEKMVEKEFQVETGKLLAQISCGSGIFLPIANITLPTNPAPLSVSK